MVAVGHSDRESLRKPAPKPESTRHALSGWGAAPVVLQSRLGQVSSGSVVALSGSVLMAAAPAGACEDVAGIGLIRPDQVAEQPSDLGHAQCDQLAVVAGFSGPLFDRVTVRKVCASIERVMCRYQPAYCRTW